MRSGSRLDERSSAGPSVATSPGRVDVAWTGSDRHLNLATSPDGYDFDPGQRLGYTSSTTRSTTDSDGSSRTEVILLRPALAVTPTGLHLAWTGSDGRLNLVRDPSNRPRPTTLAETSRVAPALAAWGDGLVLAWTGTDRRLNLATARDGAIATAAPLDQKTSCAPAVCAVGGDIVLAWTGTDRRLNLMRSPEGGRFGPPVRLDATSTEAPALCAVAGDVALAWTGTDRRLNLLVGAFTGGRTRRLDEKSSHGPSICTRGDDLIVAWTGSDRRLNVLSTGLDA
jgi:hypothetical protein